MEPTGVAEGVHEGWHFHLQLPFLHLLYDVEVVLDLLLLDMFFVACGDGQSEAVAEVFVEHLVEAEDEDCCGVGWVVLHCLYLSGHGEGLLGVPEGVCLCVEAGYEAAYMSMELMFCRVSCPPKSRILVPTRSAFAPARSQLRLGSLAHLSSSKEYTSHSLTISPCSFLPPKR